MRNKKIPNRTKDAKKTILSNLTINPIVRSTQDIEKWRSAIQSAESVNPTRTLLYDLYEDLLLDGVLTGLIGKRVNGVTKTRLAFHNSEGKEVQQVKIILGSNSFRELRKELMLQKFFGITLIELKLVNQKFQMFSVPRKHIKPVQGKITFEQYDNEGIEYRLPPYNKFMIEVGEADDLGLLLKAAPYIIYKRGSFCDWANYAQIFGMPFREARYDGYNQQVYAQLEMALEKAGSAAYAILPNESSLTFHEAKNQKGSSQLYNDLRKACNEELSILIVGQTETTTSSASSGYAQSKTHLTVEESINQSDRNDELCILNSQVLPVLENLGYPVKSGKFLHIPDKEKLGLKSQADVIIKLRNEGKLPIDDDYIYQQFGIRKPKNYDEIKKRSN